MKYVTLNENPVSDNQNQFVILTKAKDPQSFRTPHEAGYNTPPQ